jgi:hypothetical protein
LSRQSYISLAACVSNFSAASSAKIRRDLGSKLVYLAAHVIMETMITLSQQILDVLHQELLIFPSPVRNYPVGFARTHEGAWVRSGR